MKAADKHYKIINCNTGYTIYYCTLSCDLSADSIKAELEKIKIQVAVKNNILFDTLYWDEIKEEIEEEEPN
ncbi:MAG: hypothetical protein JWR67_3150 [Mucilaginibacter sp.]|nr:hypothetical protein [Mucilaginibacter sp.]